MQDKKEFGKYILGKRKEANLTQEELAKRLFVIPTTISKWERGISYPDITMITTLCKELNISEHEFFMACDDESFNQEKRELKKYRLLKKGMLNFLNFSYIIALITCFICNLAINHSLTWFLIVLVSIPIAFLFTSFPFYIKKNKYICLKMTFILTFLIYLLLFTINYVNQKNFLLESYEIATYIFSFIWLDTFICTFIKMANSYKIAISLLIVSLVVLTTNPLVGKIFHMPNDNNIYNVICSITLIIIAVFISIKTFIQNKNIK